MNRKVVEAGVRPKSRRASGTKRTAKTTAKKRTTKRAQEKTSSKPAVLNESQVEALILEHRENGRKLARSILRKWRVRMPADEIDSIVDLALCEAARRFSPEKGAAFMTFFFYHLRGHLVRSVARAAQVSSVFTSSGHMNGSDITDWQLVRGDALTGQVAEETFFGQQDIETPESAILRKEKIFECRDAVTKLDELEREIITRSFKNEEPLVDIARALGYSRCHISRVKKSALERLKVIIANDEDGQSSAVAESLGLRERTSGQRSRPKRRSRRRTLRHRDPSIGSEQREAKAA